MVELAREQPTDAATGLRKIPGYALPGARGASCTQARAMSNSDDEAKDRVPPRIILLEPFVLSHLFFDAPPFPRDRRFSSASAESETPRAIRSIQDGCETYVYYAQNVEDRLPPQLGHLQQAIEDSRTILELELDPDNGDIACSEQTWKRAVEFLRRNAKWVWDTCSRVVDLPEILPGPDGSIDLHWDYPTYEMLINIPADPNAKAGFYGDDRGEMSIKGKFDSNTFNHGLLLWLARVK